LALPLGGVPYLEPYKGRVYDPASGSGGMFVMSEKFVTEHRGNIKDITVYGQESNQTTWKLSKMNLAIRNINSKFVVWNTEGSFLKDADPDLKADYILANPPFNQKEWGVDILQEDGRWKYGTPPNGNANFAWMQHMLYHLSLKGGAKSRCTRSFIKPISVASINKTSLLWLFFSRRKNQIQAGIPVL
jgi:type I restriction enzyme M protein